MRFLVRSQNHSKSFSGLWGAGSTISAACTMKNKKFPTVGQHKRGEESNHTFHSQFRKQTHIYRWRNRSPGPSGGSLKLVLNSQPVGPQNYQSSASQQTNGPPSSSFFNLIKQSQATSVLNPKHDLWVSRNSLKHCILLHLIHTSSPFRTVISSRLEQSNPTSVAWPFLPAIMEQRNQSRPEDDGGWDLLRKKSCKMIVRASFPFRTSWRKWSVFQEMWE